MLDTLFDRDHDAPATIDDGDEVPVYTMRTWRGYGWRATLISLADWLDEHVMGYRWPWLCRWINQSSWWPIIGDGIWMIPDVMGGQDDDESDDESAPADPVINPVNSRGDA